MLKYLSVLAIGSFLFFSCGPIKLIEPTQANVTRAEKTFPGVTLQDLQQGKTHFETMCTQCHKVKDPAKRTPTQWNKVVPKMAAKADKSASKKKIDKATQESILKYLSAMSAKN